MRMAQPAVIHAPSNDISTEYTIYTYQRENDGESGPQRWQKQNTFMNAQDALRRAEAFYNTGQYCKVEIKHKTVDLNNNAVADGVLKVYGGECGRKLPKAILAIIAGFFGAVVFAVTYYFSKV